jgi:hypothetical protein
VAARATRALQHLTRRDCSSAANAVSEASFSAGHETEHRKGSGAKRRTPHTSAGAYPPAALLAPTVHAVNHPNNETYNPIIRGNQSPIAGT